MSGLQVVPLPDKQKVRALEYVELLRKSIEEGRIVAVTAVEEYNDGTYNIGSSGSMSRLQTAGALMDAAMRTLQN